MSRASGAGAYSHGIAWPSPRPQLDGERSAAGTRLVLGRVGGHARHYGTRSGSCPRGRTISAMRTALVACRHRAVPRRRRVAAPTSTPLALARPSPGRGRRWPRRRRSRCSRWRSPSVTGVIWVAGGLRTDGTASDEVFVFDPAAGTWTDGPKLPEAVHHASMVSTPAGLVLVGGYVGDALTVATSAVRRLDDGATAWTDDAPLPDARAAGAAAFDGTRIVYAGGVKPGGDRQRGLRPDRRRRVGDGRAPAGRARASRCDLGRCRADVRARRPRRRPRRATSRSSTSSRARPSTTIGELPTQARRRGRVLVAVARCLPGRWRVARRLEPPGRVHGRRRHALPDFPTSGSPATGSAPRSSTARPTSCSAVATPGLSTSDITESIALP